MRPPATAMRWVGARQALKKRPLLWQKHMKNRPLALAGRALIASVLVAFGSLAVAPATAQSSLPTLGDGGDITASAERRLGDGIIRHLYRDPDYIDDPVLMEYVQTLWQALLAAARERGELSPELDERFAWEVLLGRDRTVNAFALPGGYLGVHLGLLGVVGSRDELASVLAHELSHIRNNDMRVMSMADAISRVTSMFSPFGKFLLIFNLPLILFGSASISWWAILLMIIAPTLTGLLQLALSRTREFDADLDAIQLTRDPVGLINALRKLEHYSQNWLQQIFFPGARVPAPSILRTHPHTEDRIARLSELAEQKPELASLPTVPQLNLPGRLPQISRRPGWNVMGIWY